MIPGYFLHWKHVAASRMPSYPTLTGDILQISWVSSSSNERPSSDLTSVIVLLAFRMIPCLAASPTTCKEYMERRQGKIVSV